MSFKASGKLNDERNDEYIKKAAEEASTVILAWGKASETNLKVAEHARQVIELLDAQKEKLCIISDGERVGVHPLTPSVRSEWLLHKAEKWIETIKESIVKEEPKTEKAKENKTS